MEKCIFCEIVKGNIPAKIVGENEGAICFLDIGPVVRGHVLVIPKKHCTDLFDLDKKSASDVLMLAKEIANKMKEKMSADGVNILHATGKAAQQSVFHFHIHVIPRYDNDGLDVWPRTGYKETDFDEVLQILR